MRNKAILIAAMVAAASAAAVANSTDVQAKAPPIRMAYNYCTLAYSLAGWQEAEWHAEIARLADKGYNAALVMAGMPKVWQLTLRELGASDGQIQAYIPDEWAQPWWLMGNLEGEGGPLTDEEIDKDAALGRMIAFCLKSRRR